MFPKDFFQSIDAFEVILQVLHPVARNFALRLSTIDEIIDESDRDDKSRTLTKAQFAITFHVIVDICSY